MRSMLITGGSVQKRREEALYLCKQHNIANIDITFFDKETNTFGISLVKTIQRSILLTPLASKIQAIILQDAENLTIPAQNALLKILEEPPEHALLILTCYSKEALLPTILSRCFHITLPEDEKYISDTKQNAALDFVQKLSTLSLAKQLELASLFAKEKDVKEAVREYIIKLRIRLLEEASKESKEQKIHYALLVSLCEAHKILQTTNLSSRTVLEHCLLNSNIRKIYEISPS